MDQDVAIIFLQSDSGDSSNTVDGSTGDRHVPSSSPPDLEYSTPHRTSRRNNLTTWHNGKRHSSSPLLLTSGCSLATLDSRVMTISAPSFYHVENLLTLDDDAASASAKCRFRGSIRVCSSGLCERWSQNDLIFDERYVAMTLL
jgi:hypothetical protein